MRPPINVTFEKQVNYAGVEQPACTLCGDCCSGCNVGSKNTVQVTYLADAFHHGAEIFTEMRVSHVRQERGRWRVFFEPLGHEREKFAAADQSITCDVVVLAAGTLGSTEILLRSREEGLPVSDQLGERFTGNGDVLAFAYNNDVPVNGIGVGEPPVAETGPVGPCITGLIDLRDTPKLEDGMVIEEGSIPSALAPILPALLSAGGDKFGEDTDRGVIDFLGERARRRQSLLFGAYQGAVNRTQTYLVMSHDDGKGRMALDEGRLKLTWPKVAAQPIFEKVAQNLRKATQATGGNYTRNPLTDTLFGHNLISVHPLGGCTMGRDRTTGVVNHKCQVFDGRADARGRCRARRALRVRRLRHSAPARRQSAADDHGARRAGDDPSRQGSRLAILRDAEVRRAVARRGAGRPRDAEAGRRRVHRAHGRLHLAGDHAAARDGGAARQGGRARLQLHADGAGRRRRPLRVRSAARRAHRRHGRVSGAVARSAGDLRRQVQPDARRRSHGGDQALRLSLLARRARRLRIPVHRLQGRALGRLVGPVARHDPPQRRHRQGRARPARAHRARPVGDRAVRFLRADADAARCRRPRRRRSDARRRQVRHILQPRVVRYLRRGAGALGPLRRVQPRARSGRCACRSPRSISCAPTTARSCD